MAPWLKTPVRALVRCLWGALAAVLVARGVGVSADPPEIVVALAFAGAAAGVHYAAVWLHARPDDRWWGRLCHRLAWLLTLGS